MIYDWFIEAFSTPSGKAQFISITVSSCIAISALFLNQCLTSRRERKKLLIEKVEELYNASIDYLEACDDLVTDIQKATYREESGYHRYNQNTYNSMDNSINRIEMLCGLYFPKANFVKENYDIDMLPIFWAAISGKIARGEVNANELLEKSRLHIKESSHELKEICRDLMKLKML